MSKHQNKRNILKICVVGVIAIMGIAFAFNLKKGPGSFRVNADTVIADRDSKAPVTVDMFFDPSCPPCAIVGDLTDDILSDYMNKGEVEIVYHPTAFLNGPNNYSKLVSASILSVADNAPDKAYEYVRSVITESFQKRNRESDNVIGVLEKHLIEFGFNDDEQKKIIDDLDNNMMRVEAITKDFIAPNSKWSKFSPDGSVFAPYILINKTGEHKNPVFEPQGLGSVANSIAEAIEEIK